MLTVIVISTLANPITPNKQTKSVDNFKNASSTASNQNSATSIIKFIEENSAKIQFTPQKDLILMLGTTGAGKSTLTSFLTGANLESIETLKDSGEFVLVDRNGLITRKSTTISKTVVPNLMIDDQSGLTYYDCPGFSDSRGVANDISVSYLIKKLINSAKAVKLVFAVSFSSVRNGGDRRGFMELLNHATAFIKDVNKYRDAIALIVTKVDNRYVIKNDTPHLVGDDKMIATIALFLKQMKTDMENKNHGNVSVGERETNNKKIKFVETLLQQNKQNGINTRIGILRLADHAGSVEKMPLLQNERKTITSMINRLRYVEKRNTDFGFAISDKTKIQIYEIMIEMQTQLNNDVSSIGDEIIQFFQQQEEQILNIEELKRNTHRKLSQLKTTKMKWFAGQLADALYSLGIKISNDNINKLKRDIEAVEFLRSISNIGFDESFHISSGLIHALDYLEMVCIQIF